MKAIQVKYLPASNVKGSRVKAWTEGGNSITIPYPHELSGAAVFAFAAKALRDKMKWKGDMVGGALPDGSYAFVFVNAFDGYKINPVSRAKYYWVFTMHDGYISYRSDSGYTGSQPFNTIAEGKTDLNKVHALARTMGLSRKNYEILDDRTKRNPRPRIGTAKAKRASSVTGRAPSRRLVSRRLRNARKGYFPNPSSNNRITGTAGTVRVVRNSDWQEYIVKADGSKSESWYHTDDLQDARDTAKAMANDATYFVKRSIKRNPVAKTVYEIEGKNRAGKWSFIARYSSASVAMKKARELQKSAPFADLPIRVQKKVL